MSSQPQGGPAEKGAELPLDECEVVSNVELTRERLGIGLQTALNSTLFGG
jgi:hypothetical protein